MNREEITDLLDGCMSIDDMNEVHRLIDEIEKSKDELLMEAYNSIKLMWGYHPQALVNKAQDYISKESN